jgi:hypothetical protein
MEHEFPPIEGRGIGMGDQGTRVKGQGGKQPKIKHEGTRGHQMSGRKA